MDTVSLGDASSHVGQSVRFVAAVQQVAKGKRVLVGRQRVQPCHVLHVGDATRQFFKVTCWGKAPPALIHSSESDADCMQLSSADAELRVGDIALFSFCRIKAYRGNVEAQFVLRNDECATSSSVQLLYRKDRYFSARDVPLKDLYPMIEWYKQHCREFVGREDSPTSTAARGRKNRSTVKDLRENMVASVICKLRTPKNSAASGVSGNGAEAGAPSELDGVLLCELIMYDSTRDAMTVNLWDLHAEKRFVARLLEHRGAVEVDGVVMSLQALSNQLLGNTTPHTAFRLLDPDDPESVALEKKLVGSRQPFQASTLFATPSRSATFASLDELEAATLEGQAALENVRVEQVCFGRYLGTDSSVLAKFAPHLAERYCMGCDQALPELPRKDSSAELPRFAACTNKCKTRRGSTAAAPCGWRYHHFSMVLRDSRNERLQVEVDNQAAVEMVGNIEAQVLIESCESEMQGSSCPSSQFHVASAVASLLNALVEDPTQKFDAQLVCSTVKTRASQTGDSYQDSSHGEDDSSRRVFTLLSLAPSDAFSV